MFKRLLVVLLLLYPVALSPAQPPPVPDARPAARDVGKVSVVDFGARPNTSADSTQAFSRAAKFLHDNYGGGIVDIPSGTFFVQGVDLYQGVTFQGRGMFKSIFSGATRLRLPDSPTPGLAMFRRPTGHNPTNFAGAGFADMELDGRQFGGVPQSIPSAPTSANADEWLIGVDLRFGPRTTILSVDTGAEEIRTTTPHGLTTGSGVALYAAPGGTLPGGVTAQPGGYRWARVISDDRIQLYTSEANANTGGPTGRVDLTSAHDGTVYVGGAQVVNQDVMLDRVYIHNFDIGVRGACLSDRFVMDGCWTYGCWYGCEGQEHPRLRNSRFYYCEVGTTGRFLDMRVEGGGWAFNNYGFAPLGATAGGSAWLYNNQAASNWYVNTTRFDGCLFAENARAGLTLGASNTLINTRLQGNASTQAEGIGIRIFGRNNQIIGGFAGQGNNATSFGRAAILLDTSEGSDLRGVYVQSMLFNLTSGAFIQGGRTNATTPLFGTGNYGSVDTILIAGNTGTVAGRFLDFRSGNGFMLRSIITGNQIAAITGLTSSDGVFEAGTRTDSIVSNNSVNRVSGSAGFGWKHVNNGLQAQTSFTDNRWHNFSSPSMNFAVAPNSTSYFRNNSGFLTEATGTVTLNGTTPVNVAHGLALTPSINNITLTPRGDVGSDVRYWVSAVDGTNITVVASGASTAVLNWSVRFSP